MIGILTFQKFHGRRIGAIGSSVIRGDWICETDEEFEIYQEGKKYDVVIFQKVYWKEYLEIYKGIKILDLCDPDWMSGQMNLKELSLLVDAITTSTPTLKEYVEQIVETPVYYVPDRIKLSFFKHRKKHVAKARNVIWFGYYHNLKNVIGQVLPGLKRLGLNLVIISNNEYRMMNDYRLQIENRKFIWETLNYDLMAGDILINPQPLNNIYKFKSNNKNLIAAACGIPVANDADELKKLIDPEERQKRADLDYKELVEKWDVKISGRQIKDIINEINGKKNIV